MDKQREAFEAWAKAPPREFYLARHPDAAAWPGNYKDYHVECAWQAWQAAQQAKWLPIETAPMDGRVVDVWSKMHGRLTAYVRTDLGSGNVFYEQTEGGYTCVRDVTHWMPLPPEPKP